MPIEPLTRQVNNARHQALDGHWIVERHIFDGLGVVPSSSKDYSVECQVGENHLKIWTCEGSERHPEFYYFVATPGEPLGHINLIPRRLPLKDARPLTASERETGEGGFQGIYQLEGDTLTLYFPKDSSLPRPTKMPPEGDTKNHYFYVLKRADPGADDAAEGSVLDGDWKVVVFRSMDMLFAAPDLPDSRFEAKIRNRYLTIWQMTASGWRQAGFYYLVATPEEAPMKINFIPREFPPPPGPPPPRDDGTPGGFRGLCKLDQRTFTIFYPHDAKLPRPTEIPADGVMKKHNYLVLERKTEAPNPKTGDASPPTK